MSYTITWDDGTVEVFDNVSEVDAMVQAAAANTGDATGDDLWEVGTYVYKEYADGWYSGVIATYDSGTNNYTVVYEDGETETFPADSDELDSIVENANNYEPYLPGQAVKTYGLSGTIMKFEVRIWKGDHYWS